MGQIEWAMWANEQAVISSGLLFLGGCLAVSSNGFNETYKHKRWEIGSYAVVLSILLLLLEYPRSKRRKGNTLQRSGQFVLTNFVSFLKIFGRNYFVRFVLYLLACIPCLLNLGCVMGATSLLVAALIYLRAAIAGEEWTPCERIINNQRTLTRDRPPSMAPPRLSPPSNNYVVDEDGDDYENVPKAKPAV